MSPKTECLSSAAHASRDEYERGRGAYKGGGPGRQVPGLSGWQAIEAGLAGHAGAVSKQALSRMRFGQVRRALANDGEHEPMVAALPKQTSAKVNVDAHRQTGVAASRDASLHVNGEAAADSAPPAGGSAFGLADLVHSSLVAAGDSPTQGTLEEILIGALELFVRRCERCRPRAARRRAAAGNAAGATGAGEGYSEGRNPRLHRRGFARSRKVRNGPIAAPVLPSPYFRRRLR
jgi:hypothetical protein